jgi:hypothetical protein
MGASARNAVLVRSMHLEMPTQAARGSEARKSADEVSGVRLLGLRLRIVMVGFVTTRHLVFHCALIVHEFGARCLARCAWRLLTSPRQITFLECI